jgi:hypothetical protein
MSCNDRITRNGKFLILVALKDSAVDSYLWARLKLGTSIFLLFPYWFVVCTVGYWHRWVNPKP